MTKLNGQNVLLCYLDEAGTTNFDSTGSRYFLYTALVLSGNGFPLHRALLECRYGVIASQGRFSNSHEGNDYFHATEDSLDTRARVFPVLKEHAADARVYSLVINKPSLPEGERTQEGLFEHAATALLRAVDYYSWALYRKWESGDPTQLERLGDNIVVVSDDVPR